MGWRASRLDMCAGADFGGYFGATPVLLIALLSRSSCTCGSGPVRYFRILTPFSRNVRKVLLQARKSLSPKKRLVHAQDHSLRILPNVVAREQVRAAEEWSERSVRYREPVADGESAWREQLLDFGEPRDQVVG